MPPDRFDAALLWDMLRYAHRVRAMTDGKSFEQYLGEEILRYAVERCVSIIGEAASKVSEDYRRDHPGSNGERSSRSAIAWYMSTAACGMTSSGRWRPCMSPN